MKQRIGIIGGGAAGMMSAVTIAEKGMDVEVVLLERNKMLGQKVMISGGGRCNVTTGWDDLKEILGNYPRGDKFLRTAMYEFAPWNLMEWIEQKGVKLKCEKDLRVFPDSDKGKDLVDMFERELVRLGVDIRFESIVVGVERKNDVFVCELRDGVVLEFDKLVIACGGRAYRHTGSVGDGYTFAENLGHSITELAPSLNSYMCKEKIFSDLAGTSFQDVVLKFYGDRDKYIFRGPMIFTHKGISGPAVFALSSLAAYEEVEQGSEKRVLIDLIPDVSEDSLRSDFTKFVKNHPKKGILAWAAQYVTKRFAGVLMDMAMVEDGTKVSEVSKKSLNKIISMFKGFEVWVIKKTPGDEFVTAGGVNLKEIDKKTMESKICPGLYFAGEVLDVDGFTGGFNLQAAWCTGRLVGQNVVEKI